MGWIERTSFKSVNISMNDRDEFNAKLEQIKDRTGFKQIISVTPATPDFTDTKRWWKVYYEYYI